MALSKDTKATIIGVAIIAAIGILTISSIVYALVKISIREPAPQTITVHVDPQKIEDTSAQKHEPKVAVAPTAEKTKAVEKDPSLDHPTDWRAVPLEPKPEMVKTIVKNLDNNTQSLLFKAAVKRRWSHTALICLAKNIYYEAGVEPDEGKYAVGQVTINRVNDLRFAKTICGVVETRVEKDDGPVCAFTWYCQWHKRPHGVNWSRSLEIARDMLYNGNRLYPVRAALFYHATYIKKPWWADPDKEITQIGLHVFYSQDKNPEPKKPTKVAKR